MLPKLYDELTTSASGYSKTFLGTINHCTKCKVTEVRNGSYTLSLETTVNDDCAGMLTSQKIIGVKANPFDSDQLFEIQRTERGTDGIIKVEGKHVKNFCCQICSEGDYSDEHTDAHETGTPAQIWNKLKSDYISTNIPFTFSSDITVSRNFSLGINTAESLGNILGGKEGSFLDVWGGEFHWNNYTIEFLSSRGRSTGYQIRYGSNISDVRQVESCESTYTHVLPYGKVSNGSHKINFYAPLYTIPNTQSLYTKVFMLDCTDLLDNYEVGDKGAGYDTCRTAMTNYARTYAANNNLGKLSVSISVTLRAELDEMQQIGLCDSVSVILDNFGTKATAKITEATYDSLLERWDKLVIGDARVTVADVIINRKRYVK